MSSRIPEELRRLVVERADGLREYCLMPEAELFAGCEVDHVIQITSSACW
jgi:hypothetical protein